LVSVFHNLFQSIFHSEWIAGQQGLSSVEFFLLGQGKTSKDIQRLSGI